MRPFARSGPFKAAAAIILVLAAAPPLHAQSSGSMPGRIEAAVGVLWTGRASFGTRDATETTGAGGTFRLFTVATELASAPGIEARVAVRVAREVEAEAHGSYASPELRGSVTFDAESSNAPIVITTPIQRFDIGGGALWYPHTPRAGGRVRVFVAGGASFVRQLEDSGTVIVSGPAYDAGGGAKLLLKTRATGLKALGVRVEGRAVVRGSQLSLDGRTHVSPALGASVFLRF